MSLFDYIELFRKHLEYKKRVQVKCKISQIKDKFSLLIKSVGHTIVRLSIFFLVIILLGITGCNQTPDRIQQALDSFQLEEGISIDLVAAEPLVIDPVALAFDENRRMYVVENRGYPDPPEGGAPTTLGQVALLEDTNNDGRYDHRSNFATGFTYPNGVLPWRGGVFVTCAPDIFYLKDTTGDGIADIREVILTGFNDTKTSQIRMSSPILGLDGLVYVTGGLNGGTVTSPQYPDRLAVSYTSADGRFHPDTYEFEITGGKSQFGLTFDSFGRRFGCSNRHPVQHIVMESQYLSRNRHFTFAESIENVSKAEADARVFPISEVAITSDFMPRLIGRSHTGTFTSACGLLVFNGSGLTPTHQGNVFICEPAQNLVQRQELHAEGVSFRSKLAIEGREFLASTDSWFNPVFLQQGPAGALYLADMHRKVIDHPSYVPEEARHTLDFESGKTNGRIYRIQRENFQGFASDMPGLSAAATTGQLVEALKSPEPWQRTTAHRLLLERSDSASIPMLVSLVNESSLAESRLSALWLLHSLGGLNPVTVNAGLSDQQSGVREGTILIAQKAFKSFPELIPKLASLSTDDVARVRFNCALALGSLEGPTIIPALAKIAAQDGADRWARAAVLSGIESRLPEFLKAFREQSTKTEVFGAVMKDLGRLFGNGASISACQTLLQELIHSDNDGWRISAALGLAEGISRRTAFRTPPEGVLFALQGKSSAENHRTLNIFISQVAATAVDEITPINIREDATTLLGYSSFAKTGSVLQNLLDSKNPPQLQLEAVVALTRQNDRGGAELLTRETNWNSYTPPIRAAVIEALVSSPLFINELFHAIQKGVIETTDISSADRQRLMKHKDPKVSLQAKEMFKDLEEGGRMQVYLNYRKGLDHLSDIALGKTVFLKTCAPCHSYQGAGGKVGPDLTGVKNQPADALLLHTLVPNYEVYPEYQAISIVTTDGQSLSGRMIAETENSLTLKTSYGKDVSILRTSIDSLANTGKSLMPDGLEQSMTGDELLALISFLKSGSDLEKISLSK